MNILTFDIEEWVLESRKANRKEKYSQYDEVLDKILAKLDEKNIKATFFCLGELARTFPDVIRKIDSFGHEIGCHSDQHLWLNKLTRAEVEEDTRRAISSLEQLIGKKVKSYRAPAFSIGVSNVWVFDVLAANGIENDCSVFPAARDIGGFSAFGSTVPSIITTNEFTIKEFPIALGNILGKRMVFSGGGYFRLVPLNLTKKAMSKMDYVMFYFHINDFITEKKKFMSRQAYESYFKESGSFINRFKRYVKSNIAVGNSFEKLNSILDRCDFYDLESATKLINWNTADQIKL